MGTRGPAPKPTALRILHGDHPGRINTREPQSALGLPKPPRWLRRAARPHYRALGAVLDGMRVLQAADAYELGVLAETFTRWLEIRDSVEVDETGKAKIKIPGRDGGTVRDPALMEERAARADFNRLAMQFGLTPASRTSLIAGAADDDTGAAALLS